MAAMASAPASTARRRASTSRSGDSDSNMSMVPSSCMACARWSRSRGAGGEVVGCLERRLRGFEVAAPLGPADDLQRFALDGAAGWWRGRLRGPNERG